MTAAVSARDETDVAVERLRFELWVLMVAARYAERRARRLQQYQWRRRADGLVDLIASAQALEKRRAYLSTAQRVALALGKLIDRQNSDELSTIERAIKSELDTMRHAESLA